MPLSDKGREILKNLRSEYGKKKGESVMYAMKNKGELTGIEKKKDEGDGKEKEK